MTRSAVRRLLSVAVPVAATLLLAVGAIGCSNNSMQIDNTTGAPQQIGSRSQLIAKADSPVIDLPVPMGFKLSEDDSEAQAIGTFRYVSHFYRGRKAKDQVASFYQSQMPANHQWHLDFIRNAKGIWRLHFAKGQERCSITIDEDLWGTTTIYAEIFSAALVRS